MSDDKVDIFMPLFVADYLAATTDLTTEEHGAYFLLLLNMWRRDGKLPCQPQRLARMVGLTLDRWEEVWLVIGGFFDLEDGHIHQKRLTRELEASRSRRRRASDNGKRGAAARWPGDGETDGNPNGLAMAPPMAAPMATPMAKASPNDSSSSSSSSPSSRSPSPPSGEDRASARPPAPPAAVKASKPPKAPAPNGNLHEQVLDGFGEAWRAKYREVYQPTPADKSQLGRALQSWTPEVVEQLPQTFAAYMRDRDPWVEQTQRHSLAFFCTSGGVNKYRTQVAAISAKEARGIAAGDQFVAMTGRGGDGGF